MCGRFSLAEDILNLQKHFNFEVTEEITPRFNIAPGQKILTLLSDGKKQRAGTMKWGLVPFWAKDEKIGYKMINARAERIDEKPSFRHAFKRRRCLIVADGFYEWQKTENGKQPYRFIMKDKKPFAFAGLWETWRKEENPLYTCTIITTKPNAVAEDIHNRMPVILHQDDYDVWLDPANDDIEHLKSLLTPYPAEQMDKYKVSDLVNSPRNDLAEVLSPLNSL